MPADQRAAATRAGRSAAQRPGNPDKVEGPVEFPCNQCRKPLRVPASAAGKNGKCPHCGAVMMIPAVSQTASTPRPEQAEMSGLTPIEEDLLGGPVSSPLASQAKQDDLFEDLPGLAPLPDDLYGPANASNVASDPFADWTSGSAGSSTLANSSSSASWSRPSANPYQSPAASPSGSGGGRRRSRQSMKMLVTLPAVFMVIAASISLVMAVIFGFKVVLGVAMVVSGPDMNAQQTGMVIGQLIAVVALIIIQVLIITGATKMMKFDNYGLSVTAAILSILPCTACWVGLPFGIWSLIVLCLPDVRTGFR